MVKINLLGFVIFVLHNISVNCSPIDEQRFKREQAAAKRKASASELDYIARLDVGPASPVDWRILRHPIKLARLIKRQHLAGNVFITLFPLHILFLLHITIKAIVHTTIAGKDAEWLDYFDSIYYPNVVGVFPEPYLFNNLILVISIYCLCHRLKCAYRLVEGALINADCYKRLSVSQVNFGYATLFSLEPATWLELIREPFGKNSTRSVTRIRHIRTHGDIIRTNKKLSVKDMMYLVNLVDFGDCYEHLEDKFRLEEREPVWQRWHCAQPVHRIDIESLRNAALACVFGVVSVSIGFFLCVMGMIYMELSVSIPFGTTLSLGQLLPRLCSYLRTPINALRMFEANLLVLAQMPAVYDGFMLYWDAFVLSSRLKELARFIEEELISCRRRMDTDAPVQMAEGNALSAKQCLIYCFQLADESSREGRLNERRLCTRRLNERIKYQVKLMGLLYKEFIDIRTMHTTFVNTQVIGSGVQMTYVISLLFAVKTVSEKYLLTLAVVAYLMPSVAVLVFCALIERSFKKLHKAVSRLMVNEANLLDNDTLCALIAASSRFQKQEDRSFRIAGHYAITPDSIAPFLAYMATGILFLNRFMLYDWN